MAVSGKSRPQFPSFLAKPKACGMRSVHSRFGANQTLTNGVDKTKKNKARKSNGIGKYDVIKKTAPDYTDVAYREAVSRLRYLLNESYEPVKYQSGSGKPEESDEESGVSIVVSDRTRTARLSPFRRQPLPQRPLNIVKASPTSYADVDNMNSGPPPPELMSFIERQEEYIDQLEKESQYCRDELSQLLGKVKDLIAENEALHEQQKTGVMKNMFDGISNTSGELEPAEKFRKRLDGPLIVFESRISELEAQLTQTKIDLRKAQEEAEMYRKRLDDANPIGASSEFFKQIDSLQREKRELHESLTKLQATIVQIREKEMDASKKVQRTLDVVDKTQFEKQQAELEVNRLKSELEHQHDKLLEVISEQTRKLAEERGQAERRYLQHVEQLNNELATQRDANSKLQLELERRLRAEEDLKRDLSAKNTTIENVKKELNSKIASLQNDLSAALVERDSIEQELNTSRMSGERTDRLNRQEANRLQIEVSSLRQRLDRTDAELMHSRRENLRLMEQISSQEKEITLLKIKLGEGKDGTKEPSPLETELNSRISEIEAKHVETVTELEGLIENQSQVMAQLKAECQSLTQKLEDSAARHKEEMANLQSNLDYLTSKLETTLSNQQWSSGETTRQSDPPPPQESQYRSPPEVATTNRKEYDQSESYQQPEAYQQPEYEQTQSRETESYNQAGEKQGEPYEEYGNQQTGNGYTGDYGYQGEGYQQGEYESQQGEQYQSQPGEQYQSQQEEQYQQQQGEQYQSQQVDQYQPQQSDQYQYPEQTGYQEQQYQQEGDYQQQSYEQPQPPPEPAKPPPKQPETRPKTNRSLRSVAQSRMQQQRAQQGRPK